MQSSLERIWGKSGVKVWGIGCQNLGKMDIIRTGHQPLIEDIAALNISCDLFERPLISVSSWDWTLTGLALAQTTLSPV